MAPIFCLAASTKLRLAYFEPLEPEEPDPMEPELPEEPDPIEPELPDEPEAPVDESLLPELDDFFLSFSLSLSFFMLESEAEEPLPLLLEGEADEPLPPMDDPDDEDEGDDEPLPMPEVDDWATATPANAISDTTSAIETFFMTTSE